MKTKIYNLIGGGSITFQKSSYTVHEKMPDRQNNFKKKFINKIKNLKYYYQKKNNNVALKVLDQIYLNAKNNYLSILKNKKKIKTKWNIDFKIYKNFEINQRCLIDKNKSKFLKTYNLKNYISNSKNIFNLECYIEYQLFRSLLTGKFPWNTSLSGSTIMYKRIPNKFNVDMIFSLNFLRV